jgi:endoglucanase
VRPTAVRVLGISAVIGVGAACSSTGSGPPPLYRAPQKVDAHVVADRTLSLISEHPQFTWLGESDAPRSVGGLIAAAKGTTVPLVLYGIPDRDFVGKQSAGGFTSASAYLAWVGGISYWIGAARAMVVVEPDALAGSLSMPPADSAGRIATIGTAVDILRKNNPGVKIYLDASSWVPPKVMANLLKQANIRATDGFSINVSNYVANQRLFPIADAISKLVGGKHYIIDSSRNGRGAGPDPTAWCNVPGRGLGAVPGAKLGSQPKLVGFFWIKRPGQSDGECNGGPPAGDFWPEAAHALVSKRNLTP